MLATALDELRSGNPARRLASSPRSRRPGESRLGRRPLPPRVSLPWFEHCIRSPGPASAQCTPLAICPPRSSATTASSIASRGASTAMISCHFGLACWPWEAADASTELGRLDVAFVARARGLTSARRLASRGHDVACYRAPRIGIPVHCTGVTRLRAFAIRHPSQAIWAPPRCEFVAAASARCGDARAKGR